MPSHMISFYGTIDCSPKLSCITPFFFNFSFCFLKLQRLSSYKCGTC